MSNGTGIYDKMITERKVKEIAVLIENVLSLHTMTGLDLRRSLPNYSSEAIFKAMRYLRIEGKITSNNLKPKIYRLIK